MPSLAVRPTRRWPCASAYHAQRSRRRIKSVAVQLTQVVGVDGLREEGAAFVRRLRLHRDAILVALEGFEPQPPVGGRPSRVLSPRGSPGAVRIKGRTSRTWHDLALYYMLFATGLRPLRSPGSRCATTCMPTAASATGIGAACRRGDQRQTRPLYFSSSRLDDALAAYFRERLMPAGMAWAGRMLPWPGPGSRLFLSPSGRPYKITPNNGEPGQNRYVCRALLEIYRKLFRYAELKGLSTQSARLTVISRMYERGADEDQVGAILGIGERSAVRELLPRPADAGGTAR